MTTTIGIRELSRGFKAFEGYDFVRIEDKKTKKIKGLIVADKYVAKVEKIISKIVKQEKQQDLDDIMQFAGSMSIDEKYNNMSSKELRKARALKL